MNKKQIFKKEKNEKIILVSNIGSASRKYFVFAVKAKEEPKEIFNLQFDEKEYFPKVKLENAFLEFFEIAKREYGFKVEDIDIIAERVVAVGDFFLQNRQIDERYVEELEKVRKYDSLHTESLLEEINKIFLIKEVCRKNKIKCKFKLIAISDSEYHNTIKEEVYIYGARKNKKEMYRKYGYHGISISEVARAVKDKYKRVIAVHLGGGGSVTAIVNGESVFNSFGMTPVSGLMNLTRVGDLDPVISLEMYERNKKEFSLLEGKFSSFERAQYEMFHSSGLFALTGEKDMRDILLNLKVKDKIVREKNEFALKVYLNKINEYIGSAFAHLGECEALVLTGSILEKSEIFREMFFKKVSWLGLSKENILILKTEEEKEMARLVVEGKFL
jgi:acetate kinase